MTYLDPAAGAARENRTSAGAPGAGTDEVQTLTIGGTPTGGSFKLGFKGQTTAAIAWTATDATLITNIQTALRALATVGGANVDVADTTMTSGIGACTITFVGALGKKAVPTISVVSNDLTGTAPTVAVAETTAGVTASGRGAPKGATLTDTTNGKVYINTGTADAPTWTVVGTQT